MGSPELDRHWKSDLDRTMFCARCGQVYEPGDDTSVLQFFAVPYTFDEDDEPIGFGTDDSPLCKDCTESAANLMRPMVRDFTVWWDAGQGPMSLRGRK